LPTKTGVKKQSNDKIEERDQKYEIQGIYLKENIIMTQKKDKDKSMS
jgi:hypothetical protein